jgi:hypothetical protein
MHVIRTKGRLLRLVSSLLPLVPLALVACSPQRYAYAPASTTSAELGTSTTNPSIATYAIPSDAARGEVRVATLGVEDGAVHVRLVVTNRNDDATWSVNESEQQIELDAEYGRIEEPARPVAGKAPQVVEIAPGKSASIDLFFPVPPEFEDAKDLVAFDVVWTVRAGDRPIMQRTAFERYLVKRPRAATPPMVDDPTERNRLFPGRNVSPGALPGPGQWPPPHPVY